MACSASLSLRLRGSSHLTSPEMVTRRFIMQKARRHCQRQLRPLVGTWFQDLFHSSRRGAFHLSLTVLCAIGRYQCFALEGGPPCFPRGFTCPAVLRIPSPATPLSPTGLSPSSAVRSSTLRLNSWHCYRVLYPVKVSFIGLGVCPVRSPLLGVSRLISFPPAT